METKKDQAIERQLALIQISETHEYSLKTPIPGIFRAGRDPEGPAFVEVGDTVKKEDILCIIEDMKMFTGLYSDVGGTISAVCQKEGNLVKEDDTLFLIKY